MPAYAIRPAVIVVAAPALARKFQAACSSPATFDRLKQVAFEEAVRIRNAEPVNLETLATYSTVRMENPVVKGNRCAEALKAFREAFPAE